MQTNQNIGPSSRSTKSLNLQDQQPKESTFKSRTFNSTALSQDCQLKNYCEREGQSISDNVTSSSSKKESLGQSTAPETEDGAASQIKDVWQDNFYEELATLSSLIETNEYNIISFDTEFPGILYEGKSWVNGYLKYKPTYEWICKNVNELKLIQIGITIADSKGRTPQPISTWQFNMQFDQDFDTHIQSSIQMLKEAGLDFQKHAKVGINHEVFAKFLKGSGLIKNKNLTWVAFNSSFDFAYMVKMLDDQNQLPTDRYEFLKRCNMYFPNFYDVKQLEISTGSLAQQAIKSDIKWEGNSHQAGSDSLVTMKLFCSRDGLQNQKLRKNEHQIDRNVIYKFDHYSNSDDEIFSSKRKQNYRNNKGRQNQNNYRYGQSSFYQKKKQDYEYAKIIAQHIGSHPNFQNQFHNIKRNFVESNENFYSEEQLHENCLYDNENENKNNSSGDLFGSLTVMTKANSAESNNHDLVEKQFYEDQLTQKFNKFNIKKESQVTEAPFDQHNDDFYSFVQTQTQQQFIDPLTNIDMVHPSMLESTKDDKISKLKVPMSTNAMEFVPGRNNKNLTLNFQFDQFDSDYSQSNKFGFQQKPRNQKAFSKNKQGPKYFPYLHKQAAAEAESQYRQTIQVDQQTPNQQEINRQILREFIENNINMLSAQDQKKLENIARVHKIESKLIKGEE